MKNKYLKDFVVLRHQSNPQKITIVFSILLTNAQKLVLKNKHSPTGLAVFIYKIKKITADPTKPAEELHWEVEDITFSKSVDDALLESIDEEFEDSTTEEKLKNSLHITSLHIIHNPAMDRESMTTADAPSI